MELSVVIATMDRAEYLERQIQSLRAGTVLPRQVVIVDSSHRSETRQVVERWAAGWPAVHYLYGGEIGTSEARNAGVAATSTELVLITDDDCLTHSECVATIVDRFNSDREVDCICGSVLPYGDVRGKVAVAIKSSRERREWRGKSRPWGIGHSINMAFRRSAYDRVGGFDREMGPGTKLYAAEDLDVLYRVLSAGGKVTYEPEAIIYHDQWRSPSQARQRRADYARGTAAFLLKHIMMHRDSFALRMALLRLWEDVPWLALTGLAKRNLECELVSMYQAWGLTAGFWVAGCFYTRKLLSGGRPLAAGSEVRG